VTWFETNVVENFIFIINNEHNFAFLSRLWLCMTSWEFHMNRDRYRSERISLLKCLHSIPITMGSVFGGNENGGSQMFSCNVTRQQHSTQQGLKSPLPFARPPPPTPPHPPTPHRAQKPPPPSRAPPPPPPWPLRNCSRGFANVYAVFAYCRLQWKPSFYRVFLLFSLREKLKIWLRHFQTPLFRTG